MRDEIVRGSNGEWLARTIETDTQTVEIDQARPARQIRLSLSEDGQLVNDGTDTETVRVEVVDGLEVAKGTPPSEAAVLDVDSDATVVVDGSDQVVSLTEGSGSLDVTTTAAAGSTISVEAVGLAEHPAERDSAEINVVSN